MEIVKGDQSGTVAAEAPKAPESAVPFWALMSATFILLLAPQTLFPALASLRIALLTATAAMTAYLFDRFVHRLPIMIFTREIWITVCLVGWAILTLPLSYWPGGSVSVLVGLYFKTLAMFWLVGNVVNTLTRVRQVAWGLSLMAIPLAAFGVKQYFSGNFLADAMVKRIVGYDAPLTANPNDLALMLNLILPLSVALLLVNRKLIVRAILLGIIFLDVICVILTLSRAGFLTLATTVVMYLWKLFKRPERGWALAVLVLALVSIPLLPSGYFERLATITDIASDRTGSSQQRWTDILSAVRLVFGNPIIGAGVGMNVLALNQERGPSWGVVHNAYLEYAVDLGIPGLVLFLLLLVGCIKNARLVQRRSARVSALRELCYLAEGIEITLVAFTVAALFYPVAYHIYFYYFAGLAVAVKAVQEAEERNSTLDQNECRLQRERSALGESASHDRNEPRVPDRLLARPLEVRR